MSQQTSTTITVVKAAIEYPSGEVIVGNRHGHIIFFQSERGISSIRANVDLFLTSDDRLVDRKTAAEIAYTAGQLTYQRDVLYSEDILPGEVDTSIWRTAEAQP